jgi:predicted aminopeptidase
LNTVATYHDWVPAFQRFLRDGGGNLEAFYRQAKALAKRPKTERDRRLAELGRVQPD